MLRKITKTWPVWFTLPIRFALGGIMLAHGAQKVLGIFGGAGFNAVINNPNTPYPFMRPAWLWWAQPPCPICRWNSDRARTTNTRRSFLCRLHHADCDSGGTLAGFLCTKGDRISTGAAGHDIFTSDFRRRNGIFRHGNLRRPQEITGISNCLFHKRRDRENANQSAIHLL